MADLGTAPLFTQLPRAKFFSVFSEIKVSERARCKAPCKLQAHSLGTLGIGRATNHIRQIHSNKGSSKA